MTGLSAYSVNDKLLMAALIVLVACLLIAHYFDRRKYNRILLRQQQSIKAERQRISSEIHDDISPGLFAIKLLADMTAANNSDNEDLGRISKMLGEISVKIREIIWSSNAENDNLENLLYYIHFQISALLEPAGVDFRVNIPDEIPDITIPGEHRKNIYLIAKELVYNAVKHSKGSRVILDMQIADKYLQLKVKDNGIGFNIQSAKVSGMGLTNVKARIKELQGSMDILSDSGTTVVVKIAVKQ